MDTLVNIIYKLLFRITAVNNDLNDKQNKAWTYIGGSGVDSFPIQYTFTEICVIAISGTSGIRYEFNVPYAALYDNTVQFANGYYAPTSYDVVIINIGRTLVSKHENILNFFVYIR